MGNVSLLKVRWGSWESFSGQEFEGRILRLKNGVVEHKDYRQLFFCPFWPVRRRRGGEGNHFHDRPRPRESKQDFCGGFEKRIK